MLELSQFNLQFALSRSCALGKNIEDQRSPIENLAIKDSFQVSALGRGKLVIKNHRVDVLPLAKLGEFVRLAPANERAGHGRFQLLGPTANHIPTRGSGQLIQFVQGIPNLPRGARLLLKADEEDPLGSLAAS